MSRKRIFEIIQIGRKDDFWSLAFDYFITAVILINLAVTFILTYSLSEPLLKYMQVLELLTMIIFTIEYGLRLWTAEYLYPRKRPAAAILRFMISFYGIIDILTILPYWLPIETIYGIGVFRIVRVVRILHLFRVNSQSDAYNVIVSVICEKRKQLLSSISIIGMLILAASFLMYSVEHTVQPDVFDNAFSGIWWAVSSVLTVGYGDIYPVTVPGRILAIIICILGVMITAIPTGILSAGFSENYNESRLADLGNQSLYKIEISRNNAWIHMPVHRLREEYDIHVISLIRGNTQVDLSEAVIEAEDTLICRS